MRATTLRETRHMDGAFARRRWMGVAVPTLVCLVLAFHQVIPKPDASSTALSASRALELVLVGASVLLALALPARRHVLPPTAGWATTLLMGFSGWAFVTSFWSPLPLTGAVKALEMGAIGVVAWRVAASAPGEGEARRRAVSDAVLRAVLIAVAALIASNVVAMGNPLPIMADEVNSFTGEGNRERLMLGFNHPLSSAALLAFGVVFAFDSTLRPGAKAVSMAFLFTLLLLCDARGITAAIPVGMLLGFWLRVKPSLLTAWAGVAAAVAGLGGLALLLAYFDPLQLAARLFGDDVTTLNSRSGLWSYVISIGMQHPLGGVGFFGTRHHILAAFPFAGHAHNSFLEVFVSTGLPGLALLLAFVGLAIGRVIRSGDPLLAGLLPLALVEGNLNPLLFAPVVPMALFTLALLVAAPRAAAVPARSAPPLRHAAAWR